MSQKHFEVHFPKNLATEFRRASKNAFPKEEFAILLGDIKENGEVIVEDLFFPPGREEKTGADKVEVLDKWYFWAVKIAQERKLLVVGDIHSHPYAREFPVRVGMEPSEHDFENARVVQSKICKSFSCFGICKVLETRSGLRTYYKFWPVIPSVGLNIE